MNHDSIQLRVTSQDKLLFNRFETGRCWLSVHSLLDELSPKTFYQLVGKESITIDFGERSKITLENCSNHEISFIPYFLLLLDKRHNLPEDDQDHGPLANLPDFSYLSKFFFRSRKKYFLLRVSVQTLRWRTDTSLKGSTEKIRIQS